MKGIILAGGSGTRLDPLTISINKQLLPVYDKPMIYYPLSTLMLAGIREILIITTPEDLDSYKKLLGNGTDYGIRLEYAIQPSPDGLAQAFIIGEEFIGSDPVCLILGDNIFYGSGLQKLLVSAIEIIRNDNKAVIFGSYVTDPERYGVVDFDSNKQIISLQEKPKNPRSNYAVVGLYFYPNSVVRISKDVKPSSRGELEITSVNNTYLEKEELELRTLSRGYAWLDTGTHESLAEATEFVKTIEKRTSLKIGCIEEIALNYGWINKDQIKIRIQDKKGEYYSYLNKLIS